MQMHAKGPGAGWNWLVGGFTVFKHNTGTILGAAVVLALFMAVPTIVQMLLKPQGSMLLVVVGAIMLISGVVYPVLLGGFMRVIDASRGERPTSVAGVFEPFQPGQGGARLALFGLCMMAFYVTFLAVVLSTVGHGMATWYMQLLEMQAQRKLGMPPLPAGSSITLALVSVFFLFYTGAMAIGIGQVSLRRQSPIAGFRDGIAGAFKNVLPLVVLTFCGIVLLVVVSLVFGIVMAIVVGLAALASKVLAIILLVPLYLALVVAIFTFMMGVNYAVWYDVADAGSSDDAVQPALPGAAG